MIEFFAWTRPRCRDLPLGLSSKRPMNLVLRAGRSQRQLALRVLRAILSDLDLANWQCALEILKRNRTSTIAKMCGCAVLFHSVWSYSPDVNTLGLKEWPSETSTSMRQVGGMACTPLSFSRESSLIIMHWKGVETFHGYFSCYSLVVRYPRRKFCYPPMATESRPADE